jgi:hypothetical protein
MVKLNIIYELIWVKSIVGHLQIPNFMSAEGFSEPGFMTKYGLQWERYV